MQEKVLQEIESTLTGFVAWLADYGETSWDHQSYFAGGWGRKAKSLYYRKPLLGMAAVAPMILSEALLPSARRLFWKRQRLPIADAHYAMGFAYLCRALGKREYHERAVHFLQVLQQTRCPGFQYYCWGYPFDWETRGGTITAGTPLITTTPYVYEAFADVYEIDGDVKWLQAMHSIAEHAVNDIKDFETGPDAATCSYTPDDAGGVINASAYRSFLLMKASRDFQDEPYRAMAERNLNFVLQSQQPDGSWQYSRDGVRDFVDHFHTCFVLKALAKIEHQTGHKGCTRAIERGVGYYVENLFDQHGHPKPFSKPPRLTVYEHELYDYAECINLGVLLRGRFERLDRITENVVEDVLTRWKKSDGSFRSRKLYLGWDNVPMHRWAQSQLFRSLSLVLHKMREPEPRQHPQASRLINRESSRPN